MSHIREIKILVKHHEIVRSAFKVAFSMSDSSLYLFPYGTNSQYFYGGQTFPEKELKYSFNWEDIFSDSTPKLSIHESGQVHIKSQGTCAGPLQTLSLADFRGEHLASVTLDTVDSCPEYSGEIKTSGQSRHLTFPVKDKVQSVRFILYANGVESRFRFPCQIVVEMMRQTIQSPLYLGIAIVPQNPLVEESSEKKGTTVLAGWKPRQQRNGEIPFLFLRAE